MSHVILGVFFAFFPNPSTSLQFVIFCAALPGLGDEGRFVVVDVRLVRTVKACWDIIQVNQAHRQRMANEKMTQKTV